MAGTINPTYANTTISSAALSSGSGLTYTAGTGVGYNPVEATWSAGTSTTTATIHGKDFILDGVSLKSILEERLNMLVPNPEMEKEWAELKQLGDSYRKLEAECKEKSKMWKALKKT